MMWAMGASLWPTRQMSKSAYNGPDPLLENALDSSHAEHYFYSTSVTAILHSSILGNIPQIE